MARMLLALPSLPEPWQWAEGIKETPLPQPYSRNSLPESQPLPAWPCGPHRQGFLVAGLVWWG